MVGTLNIKDASSSVFAVYVLVVADTAEIYGDRAVLPYNSVKYTVPSGDLARVVLFQFSFFADA